MKLYMKKTNCLFKSVRYIKRIWVSVSWFLDRFMLSIPSKHIRRWYLNSFDSVNVEKNVAIYGGFKWWSGNLRIGRGTSIGFDNHFDCRNGVYIGNNVDTATGVMLWSLHHDYNDIKFKTKGGSIYVGDYVWLGARCVILPGVTIGEGAVVAAGAVVSKDVKAWTVVGGVPAKQIGERERKNYEYCPSDYWIPFF